MVNWALPDGRGAWCNDCYTTHRTFFISKEVLTYFADWLNDKPEQRASFNEVLYCYLSLRVENDPKITFAKLSQRLEVLKWAWSQGAAHPSETVVIPLADALSGASPWGRVVVSPTSLTTMWSEAGGYQLGVRVAHSFQSGAQGVFARPVTGAHPLKYGPQQFLATENAADRTWLSENFGVSPRADEAASAGDDAVVVSVEQGASAIAKRFRGLSTQAKAILQKLTQENWARGVPESALTNSSRAIAALQVEAGQVGESTSVYEEIKFFAAGLQDTKLFLKAISKLTISPTPFTPLAW